MNNLKNIETAIILAGGKGTRLKKIVSDVPKPMAPINNRPFLEYLMDYWINQGISKFILSVGYLNEVITNHFGNSYGSAQIEYVFESSPLGTGGGLLLASKDLNESFLLLNGDTFFEVKLSDFYSFHKKHNSEWTMSLFRSFDIERYMSTYPQDKNMVYGHYLLAMCYYENIEDEKKDLAPLIQAKKKFKFILKEYPETDFALDASFKIDLINDIMASKEMYIGRHYIKKEKWIAAINRFKTVTEDYQTTIYVEEAIHRLVEIYYRIGLIDESKKYANLLGYNYLSSDWYTKSYKIFDQDIKTPKIKIEKNSLLKKFKKLF